MDGTLTMALDGGAVGPDLFAANEANGSPLMRPPVDDLVLTSGAHLGEGLRAAREARRFSVDDVAAATKILPKHVLAIEALELNKLPSRPFAVGYIRAYAKLLGVDEDRVLLRFKADAPEAKEPLRAPVGVQEVGDPRLALIAVGTALVLGAIIVWNVAQRMMAEKEPQAVQVAQAPLPKSILPNGQPVKLGPALPAPAESTVPAPYITPGLDPNAPPTMADPTVRPAAPPPMLPEAPMRNPNAAVYGAPPQQSIISLRARKSVALIVNTADGAIFTRVLAIGETYRAPLIPGLTFDVSDPTGVDVYRQGQFIGQLPALITPASKLGG